MRFVPVIIALIFLSSCSKGITKILKSPDPEYKLRVAEKYFVQKKYTKAQVLFEDVMPYYKTRPEFQDIYYKYAYCAYNQADYLNAENLFKTFLEIFPNSTKAEEMAYMRAYSYYKQSPKPELDQTNTIKAMGMMQVFINTHPGSEKNKEATAIIETCRAKLETKDYKGAFLYYNMSQFRAAGVAFTTLINAYPESSRLDEYKLMAIKSYYRFAELSVEEKKAERYEQVIDACHEFVDRFPESKFRKEVEDYIALSQTNIKNLNSNI
ncbi:MAG: outer membrane protein assembly factor BamD [Chitinophagaceae bacterium]|jgi:outer membrane protein assembly factor BamD|nr:outer membrane protein assembly factor BamD [Sphingobacteriales bacterium]OJW04733.1 MAG: outer membrane protein assembly factor BamD [Sphingobacteriales bacterium 44-61]TXJ22547.1 MAG: outer membrane protein assembly factor BamD [Chitinophagaceae bacterium]